MYPSANKGPKSTLKITGIIQLKISELHNSINEYTFEKPTPDYDLRRLYHMSQKLDICCKSLSVIEKLCEEKNLKRKTITKRKKRTVYKRLNLETWSDAKCKIEFCITLPETFHNFVIDINVKCIKFLCQTLGYQVDI
ncbi:hypothetical protein PHYBLDRAFT_165382 [Phycomyces blakesleeanus NRRL 1555(-)]|uniref:Uncharacterized protein n=1 Tax=Phycomyces blakesleeanus (strain ATCC 8743b / DSM 1359 / FGSC 10004 / NBRC 33097 / NRRL 1555) TaxID=763407 RepID=A0A162UL37_PHYB8|nr:hypothetical protein PHYBLDRAFT_165382 [Phycomyces blakesleeanus NRRL 1555(-)]OAD76882.1 hypothetical protein PHYBLDRAFT_165382 [Phycomyces blakesleeanus NRRL 1555(-)]|eukprot:XP_018294922.1 hypothetical protein PHYBLDRAFT_165382 [Phycomyces blakesleeanus NRRL 1555(-)]